MSTHRRRLLQAIAFSGGAASVANVPTRWSRPAVDAVMLPAHAQTTPGTLNGSAELPEVARTDQGDGNLRFAAADPDDRSILDFAVRPAHAIVEPRPQLLGFAAPAGGAGLFLVQVMIHGENILSSARSDEPAPGDAPTLPERLIRPAYAFEPAFCNFAVLWEGEVSLDIEQSNGRFASPVLSNVPFKASCGTGSTIPPLNMRLHDMENRTAPSFGSIGVVLPGTTQVIPLAPGGGPLSADCEGTPCPGVM